MIPECIGYTVYLKNKFIFKDALNGEINHFTIQSILENKLTVWHRVAPS